MIDSKILSATLILREKQILHVQLPMWSFSDPGIISYHRNSHARKKNKSDCLRFNYGLNLIEFEDYLPQI